MRHLDEIPSIHVELHFLDVQDLAAQWEARLELRAAAPASPSHRRSHFDDELPHRAATRAA
jgi:hypothetical protein